MSEYPYENCLTNEKLYKRYRGSQFDIVNKAIALALEEMNAEKDGAIVDADIDNLSYKTLEMLADYDMETVCKNMDGDAEESAEQELEEILEENMEESMESTAL